MTPYLGPMLRDLVRFLFLGDRAAILRLTGDSRSLWIGLALLLTAGMAREYDREDLLAEPWHLLLPPVVSLGMTLVLFLWLRIVALRRWDVRPPWILGFRALLIGFWLQAPMAWLYAIPWEQMTDEATAMSYNLMTVKVVSAWRIIITVRVLTTIFGLGTSDAVLSVLMIANTAMFMALQFLPFPIFAIMGGIEQEAWERQLAVTGVLWQAITFLAGLPLLLAAIWVASRAQVNWVWRYPVGGNSGLSAMMGVILAVMVALGGAMTVTQPAQQRRTAIEAAWQRGDLDGMVRQLTAFSRQDLPHWWKAPPVDDGYEVSSQLVPALNAALDQAPQSWLVEVYLLRLYRSANESLETMVRVAEMRPDLVATHDLMFAWLRGHLVREKQSALLQRLDQAVEPNAVAPE